MKVNAGCKSMRFTEKRMHKLFTVGFSSYPKLEDFFNVLKKYDIQAIADVRSQPYSSYYKDYNKEYLEKECKAKGFLYGAMGKWLGARRDEHDSDEAQAYDENGVALYERIVNLPWFRQGITHLKEKTLPQRNVVLLCAEKDPLTCHRAILIGRHMSEICDVIHIWPHDDKELETHKELERRLEQEYNRKSSKPQQLTFWGEPEKHKSLDECYKQHGEKIAYKKDAKDKQMSQYISEEEYD